MSAESATATAPVSGRAAIAMLTLQVRAAQQEAAQAEAAADAADEQAVRSQLPARPDPTVEARTRELDAALALAREEAAATVAAAHRQAALIGAENTGASTRAHDSVAVVDAQQMATVLATMLDERLSHWAPAPAPRKPSFWSHVFHLDVMIVAMVMIFCLVVVAAWMS